MLFEYGHRKVKPESRDRQFEKYCHYTKKTYRNTNFFRVYYVLSNYAKELQENNSKASSNTQEQTRLSNYLTQSWQITLISSFLSHSTTMRFCNAPPGLNNYRVSEKKKSDATSKDKTIRKHKITSAKRWWKKRRVVVMRNAQSTFHQIRRHLHNKRAWNKFCGNSGLHWGCFRSVRHFQRAISVTWGHFRCSEESFQSNERLVVNRCTRATH